MSSQSKSVALYDTTLRDGTQQRGISLTVEDKLRCAQLLASFGFDYIEGGWPGSNPKDEAFFLRAQDLDFGCTKLAAFGATRRKNTVVEDDPQLQSLLAANTPVVTLVGKSSLTHVTQLLGAEPGENHQMIFESVALCKAQGREVIFDAEHFFDGYRDNPSYALECLQAAAAAGADVLVLCDTNGGTLPSTVSAVVSSICSEFTTPIGIHAHNDSGVAVANSLLAVEVGARHVQGTINGYGERCGNANLISIIPGLFYKLGFTPSTPLELSTLTTLSRQVAELVNENHAASQPYTGRSAFAHKGGLHVAAVEKMPASYEHLDPQLVGNQREIVVSELSGRGTVRMIAKDSGLALENVEKQVLDTIKEREHAGYAYESAEGSAELLMRRLQPSYQAPFTLLETSVMSRGGFSGSILGDYSVEASVKLSIQGEVIHTVADGSGPVHALDMAIRKALLPVFPFLKEVQLSNYKVRILNPSSASMAKTRVMIEASDRVRSWVTVGCSENIIHASIEALLDSYELCVVRNDDQRSDVDPVSQVNRRRI